jgi:hypothetical protein
VNFLKSNLITLKSDIKSLNLWKHAQFSSLSLELSLLQVKISPKVLSNLKLKIDLLLKDLPVEEEVEVLMHLEI